jgi:hypothetical protein
LEKIDNFAVFLQQTKNGKVTDCKMQKGDGRFCGKQIVHFGVIKR